MRHATLPIRQRSSKKSNLHLLLNFGVAAARALELKVEDIPARYHLADWLDAGHLSLVVIV